MFGVFGDWDLLLMPTMPGTAFDAEAEVPRAGEDQGSGAPLPWITWTPYTYPFNITGQPAITVPCGLAADGLPAGLQIVGPWAHDTRVLDFAHVCERALEPLNQIRVAPGSRDPAVTAGKGDLCVPLSACRESTLPRTSSTTSPRSTGSATTRSG
jgi:aspartyl-tRNA(Asn)/glutamyl-tRNA(Gln) amidotransferase subunit A